MSPIRLTRTVRDVLDVFLAHPESETYGLLVCQTTGLGPGTVYPILSRLVRVGWLQTSWEKEHVGQGPKRRLYRLTSKGLAEAPEALKVRERALRSRLGWAR
ncbi:PadR family transcriptional regulator [Streptosporangiaceae bacterium NEAU-GS5]|nr:PadR family transcriptional regulator [Streptosporangiaceae bacterium NEAU-GS5]